MRVNSDRSGPAKGEGFTLIELLMVVAIIAALSAIAVPNFLEAQIRAKLGRAKSEMRELDSALSAYYVDYNHFPLPALNGHGARLWRLSTPVAYHHDPKHREPFKDDSLFPIQPYGYHGRNELVNIGWNNDGHPAAFSGTDFVFWYVLRSSGPDNDRDGGAATALNSTQSADDFINFIYDPSNGTVSRGDVWRAGGMPLGNGVDSVRLMNARW